MSRRTEGPLASWLRIAAYSSLLALALGSSPSPAAEFTLTGFGTLGYAVTDRDLQYLRYIDDRGTFKADSLLGVQGEVRFTPQWSATLQAVASAPRDTDEGMEAKVRWAFVGFRPSNDWLIRLGRVRPPVFLHTQNSEVGVTYDAVRLPAEVYSLSPVYDVDGVAINKAWILGADTEVNAEAYWGKTDADFRIHYRRNPPANFVRQRVTARGGVVSFQTGALSLRTGFHLLRIGTRGSEQHLRGFDAVPVHAPAPFGGILYVPQLGDEIDLRAFTLSADWNPNGWRVTAEFGHLSTPDSDVLANNRAGYVSVARQVGSWTPYASYARLLSPSKALDTFRQLFGAPVPLAAQGPPGNVPANFHRVLADSVNVNDQYSVMLGAAYSLSPTMKLKVEWMRTRVGLVSNLVDGDVRDKSFNVFSVAYSAAF